VNGISEPFLYNAVAVSDGPRAVALAQTVAGQRLGISDLLLYIRFEKVQGTEHLTDRLALMRKLQDMSLEIPDYNARELH
jgi:hypothetical protein